MKDLPDAPPDWASFFACRRDDFAAYHWREVAEALQSVAPSANIASLKRYVRELQHDTRGPDPWCVEAVLRAAGIVGVRGPAAPLLASTLPAHDLREPALELRAFAIARRVLGLLFTEAPSPDADPKALPGLEGTAGTELIWWYLTGSRAPTRSGAADYHDLADAASGVDRVLAPLGLLSASSREDRRSHIRMWAAHGMKRSKLDAVHREFCTALDERSFYLDLARDACVAALRPGDPRIMDIVIELSSRMVHDVEAASGAASLASWCTRARALGIVSALRLRDHRYSAYQAQIVDHLVAGLRPLVVNPPLSLLDTTAGVAFWRALAIFVRERADAGATAHVEALLQAAAETGSWTRAIARHLARVTGLLSTAPKLETYARAELAKRLVMRLAVTTMRSRHLPAHRLWGAGLGYYVEIALGDPAAELVEQWWKPIALHAPLHELPRSELVRMTERMSGDELAGSAGRETPTPEDLRACVAWWSRPDIERAFVRDESQAAAPLAARVREMLASDADDARSPPPRSSHRRIARMTLSIHRLEGRNGEEYVLTKLFGVSDRGVITLVEEEVYPRPVDQAARIDTLRQAMRRLREDARSGLAPSARLDAVERAIRALGSREMWSDLAAHVAAPDTELEISATDFGFPWELAPLPRSAGSGLGSSALGLAVPTFRRRGGPPNLNAAADPPCRSLLVLCDRRQDGVHAEIDAIQQIWSPTSGGTLRIVDRASTFRALPDGEAFDVVHYAGHQGPALDATPALFLGDDRLPIQELVDRFHARPPRLVFLNACSTLAASEALAIAPNTRGTHLVFGPLEPLVRSRIPTVIGTLWDVSPPSDQALIRVFYDMVARGHGFVDALHASRRAVSRDDRWAPWWPAYVILST